MIKTSMFSPPGLTAPGEGAAEIGSAGSQVKGSRPAALVRPARTDQRGNSTIETALVVVAFFLVVFGAIQADIYYHGRNAAQSAAAACAERARGAAASSSEGRQSADSILSQAGALDEYSVAVSATATTVTCTVTGHAPVVIDLGGLGQLEQTAAMPKERVTRPSGGFVITEGPNGGN